MSAVREQRATSFLISDIIILMVSKPLRSRLFFLYPIEVFGLVLRDSMASRMRYRLQET